MKKLRSQKAETLVETLMAILVVVLVMLFLSPHHSHCHWCGTRLLGGAIR